MFVSNNPKKVEKNFSEILQGLESREVLRRFSPCYCCQMMPVAMLLGGIGAGGQLNGVTKNQV